MAGYSLNRPSVSHRTNTETQTCSCYDLCSQSGSYSNLNGPCSVPLILPCPGFMVCHPVEQCALQVKSIYHICGRAVFHCFFFFLPIKLYSRTIYMTPLSNKDTKLLFFCWIIFMTIVHQNIWHPLVALHHIQFLLFKKKEICVNIVNIN